MADVTTAPNSQLDVAATPAPAPNIPVGQQDSLSGVVQPATPASLAAAVPITGTTEYQTAVQNANAATQRATQRAQPTPPPTPGPHARLLGMVQGLALGLGSFGTAIATHGREGGIQEVQQVQAAQQQQKIQAQQAAEAQKNAQIQQDISVADANRANAHSILLLGTVPLDLQAKELDIEGKQQELSTNEATFRATHFGMSSPEFNDMQSSNGQGGSAQNFQLMRTQISQKVQAAIQNPEVGPNDPYVKQTQAVLANSNASPRDVYTASQNLDNQVNLRHGVTAAQTASVAGLPKNEQDAAAQLAAAQNSGDTTRIAKAQSVYDAVHKSVQDERQFASNLQEQNQKANKQIALTNTLAQKGIEDTNKIWTDPQHGFSQTRAQVEATKDAAAQATNGSQLAANLEPVMTALGVNSFAGVHRINQTEIDNAGSTVGSLYRRLNAALDKAGAGAVPPDTLKEVNGIMDALLQTKYRSSLDSTRQIVANSGIPEKNISVPDPNNFGTLTTLDKVAASQTIPPPRTGYTRIRDSKGFPHDIPSNNLAGARKLDPGLTVVQ